ncbi:MAG: hypothetical protein V3V08_07360 [Nannocystaceae bacterium]
MIESDELENTYDELENARTLCTELREQCTDYRELVTGYKTRIVELKKEVSDLMYTADVQKDINQMLRKRLEKHENGLGAPHQD